MKTSLLIGFAFVATGAMAQEKKDFYITPARDTVWGEVTGFFLESIKFRRSADGKKLSLDGYDFTLARSHRKKITYIASFFDDDNKRKFPTVLSSKSKGPIYIVKRRRVGATSGPQQGFGVGLTFGGKELYLFKEGDSSFIYINTAMLSTSKNSMDKDVLKSILGDDPDSILALEALSDKKMSEQDLVKIVDAYNARKP